MKLSKCSFAQSEISYLGHIISDTGVSTDPSKTSAMTNWAVPTNATELRGFLGLTGYYRKFIKGYGVVAKPLTNLLKNKMFVWSEEAQTAFVHLKQLLVQAPVLAIPNFEEQFVIETDACDGGIGAVLMQRDKPVAFLSKALGPAHQRLSIYEKEFLALIMAVEKWRQYLQRQEFLIRTDHKSLSYLCEQNLHSDMQRKAMTQLMGLQFRVVYKKGKENVAADALSKMPHLMAIQVVSEVSPVSMQEVLNTYRTDSKAQELLTFLAITNRNEVGFSLHKRVIRYKGRVWIPHYSALQTRLIAAMHSTVIGGHSGTKATYQQLKHLFQWKGMKKDEESFIQQCKICQQAKHESVHPAGLLQPLPYLRGHGKKSQWISLRGYHYQRIVTLFLWWSTDILNMLISWHSNIPSLLKEWPGWFWTM
jgi:hypothetical protein